MYLGLVFLVLRVACPPYLLPTEPDWSPECSPSWCVYAEYAVGLIQAQPDTVRFSIQQCYRLGILSAAFGINIHFGNITCGHATGLRQLLLISGDIESNPGPNNTTLTCDDCGSTFAEKFRLTEHQKTVHGEKVHRCGDCSYATSKKSNLKQHQHRTHAKTTLHKSKPTPCQRCHYIPHTNRDAERHSKTHEEKPCNSCDYIAPNSRYLKRHLKTHGPPEPPKKKSRSFLDSDEEIQKIVNQTLEQLVNKVSNHEGNALNGSLSITRIDATGADPSTYLYGVTNQISGYIQDKLKEMTGLKMQLKLYIRFYKPTSPKETFLGCFRSRQKTFLRGTDIDPTESFPRMLASIEKFTKKGSGWAIAELMHMELYFAHYVPLHGSTYRPLPRKLKNKRAIINVKNTDQKCFLWSVLAHMFPLPHGKHPERVIKYWSHEAAVDMSGINYPVTLDQINRFERQNDIAVNVYGFEDDIYPLRISKQTDKKFIHLLFHDGHYSLIKCLDQLLFDRRKDGHRKFFCPMCLIPRTTRELLNVHMDLCREKDPSRIKMPEETKLYFKNYHRTLKQPLVVYADFECLIEKIELCSQEPSTSFTEVYQKHTPCGFGLIEARSCCGETKFSGLEVSCEKNPVKRFIQSLMMIVTDYQNEAALPMTNFDPKKHSNNVCHICRKQITKGKVKDHCHKCGMYRGPAHNECNQKLRLNRDVIVVFHNLRKYDGHLIMKEIGEIAKLQGFQINVIAKTMEDYISFDLMHKKENDGPDGRRDFSYKIKFIDSLQFLNNSLEGLVENMDRNEFHAMETKFTGEDLELMLRKGVYPYEYMDDWDKFDECQLPNKECFFSNLTGQPIKEEEYEHAKKVWEKFAIKNLGEYHNLYLLTDVLLLADVFERFRKSSMEQYNLDPCHYITAPSLAWDACLKMTAVKLELLQDPEMYLFCETGIRGGISQISQRYAKANNPYMKDFKPENPKKYIVYLDANNLYGWAMSQKMPVDGFKWIEDKNQGWENLDADGDKGYILEVDLEYPEHLHDKHNDYPLAPETKEIQNVSPYCNHLKKVIGLDMPPCLKLVPNLWNKSRYILHIKNLQLYLRLGMNLKKVHRGLEFNQTAWMGDYIMFNTEMRARANNAFEKDRLKLMNNSVFGKTMENVRKYKNVELVTSKARFQKLVANPRFRTSCRFTDDLVGVCSLRSSVVLNKPIYCGLTVLDLSKVLMYQFHYGYIKMKYGENANLLFTDTDSLCYIIETDDIYADMKKDGYLFDFSDYPSNHPCHSTANKKKIGKMKDEANGKIIEEFAGLRPKMYSLWGPTLEKKRAKGIKKVVVKNEISHADYVAVLQDETFFRHNMRMIQSKQHQVWSVCVNKKSLSPYDDKRWLLNNVFSRAHGHHMNDKTVHR